LASHIQSCEKFCTPCQEDTWLHTAGYVDPENLLFVRERIGELRKAAPKVHEAISTLDDKCAEIFRGHPFYKAPDFGPMLRRLVERPDLKLSM